MIITRKYTRGSGHSPVYRTISLQPVRTRGSSTVLVDRDTSNALLITVRLSPSGSPSCKRVGSDASAASSAIRLGRTMISSVNTRRHLDQTKSVTLRYRTILSSIRRRGTSRSTRFFRLQMTVTSRLSPTVQQGGDGPATYSHSGSLTVVARISGQPSTPFEKQDEHHLKGQRASIILCRSERTERICGVIVTPEGG